ncbi:MAG: hypothetical protein R3C52_06095 [Hyphomonadaceae bacterium]
MEIHNPFTMVVLIVAIVFGAKLWRTQMMLRARMSRNEAGGAVVSGMQEQIDRLTRRVAVLEKLATDDDRRLAGEIERLRSSEGDGFGR